jgi:hypothetical protein
VRILGDDSSPGSGNHVSIFYLVVVKPEIGYPGGGRGSRASPIPCSLLDSIDTIESYVLLQGTQQGLSFGRFTDESTDQGQASLKREGEKTSGTNIMSSAVGGGTQGSESQLPPDSSHDAEPCRITV